ncbi:MAG: 2-dehydro-3-deoxyphosphooctonate aldolase [Gammaproteobacteria bacterium]|nr:MAG: 2-dehydro-3-deoxyphosphooctonate aldolase [Gammaproteobacteria bacterium]
MKVWVRPFLIVVLLIASAMMSQTGVAGVADRISSMTVNKLQKELPILGMAAGDAVLIRTFKKESRLELWMKPKNSQRYVLFRTYPICAYSGGLGPKIRRGDRMTPEGFYAIKKNGLNPHSRFHLSMDIGYPNRYDRYLRRTGSLLMIHGACDSIGCFAMSNQQMEEIYYLVEQALQNGQLSVPVHAFPFHLSDVAIEQQKNNKWYGFWWQLKMGYDAFNQSKQIPDVEALDGRYVITIP